MSGQSSEHRSAATSTSVSGATPLLRVLRGAPDAAELAAVTAVVAAFAATSGRSGAGPPLVVGLPGTRGRPHPGPRPRRLARLGAAAVSGCRHAYGRARLGVTCPARAAALLRDRTGRRRQRGGRGGRRGTPGGAGTGRPGPVCRELAEAKATRAAEQVAGSHPGALVVGADSVLDLDGVALGKPADATTPWPVGTRWRAATGVLCTGHAVIDLPTGRRAGRAVRTTVRFGRPDPTELAAYVATGEPLLSQVLSLSTASVRRSWRASTVTPRTWSASRCRAARTARRARGALDRPLGLTGTGPAVLADVPKRPSARPRELGAGRSGV